MHWFAIVLVGHLIKCELNAEYNESANKLIDNGFVWARKDFRMGRCFSRIYRNLVKNNYPSWATCPLQLPLRLERSRFGLRRMQFCNRFWHSADSRLISIVILSSNQGRSVYSLFGSFPGSTTLPVHSEADISYYLTSDKVIPVIVSILKLQRYHVSWWTRVEDCRKRELGLGYSHGKIGKEK